MQSVSRFLEMNGPTGSAAASATGGQTERGQGDYGKDRCGGYQFQMPLHYPRYTRADYEAMPEWQLDCLLRQYGLPVVGDADEKRRFAIGAFIWPSH